MSKFKRFDAEWWLTPAARAVLAYLLDHPNSSYVEIARAVFHNLEAPNLLLQLFRYLVEWGYLIAFKPKGTGDYPRYRIPEDKFTSDEEHALRFGDTDDGDEAKV